MSKETKSDSTTKTSAKAKPSTGNAEVQAKFDVEQSQGFRGTEVDPTPNASYSVAGVTSGAPTPETDAGAANTARAETNVGLTGIEAAARDKKAAADNAANTRKLKRGK